MPKVVFPLGTSYSEEEDVELITMIFQTDLYGEDILIA
jgi:hypothetical protein